MDKILVTVNGDSLELAASATINHLLEKLELLNKKIAVELNMEIVPRSEHKQQILQAGDRIEIVHAIGGG